MLATASAIAVAALAPVSVSASAGPVTATMTAIGAASDTIITGATGMRITVARGGGTAFNGGLRPCRFGCEPNDPTGARFSELSLADLDGDGEAEVLVDRSDGFTPCCTSRRRSSGAIRRPARTASRNRHGESYRVTDLDGDHHAELVTGDLRFYQRFAPRVAGFQLPMKILQLRGPRLVDVTTAHGSLIRRATRAASRASSARPTGSRTAGGAGAGRSLARGSCPSSQPTRPTSACSGTARSATAGCRPRSRAVTSRRDSGANCSGSWC